MATKDFLAALPVGVHGGIGPVPGSKMPPPQLTLREENAATLARYKKFQEGRLFGPSRTTTETGMVIERSAPQAPIKLLDAAESVKALQAARTGLAKAITKRDGHIDAAGRAQIALEAAQRTVRRISDEIAALGDIDGLAARWRASRIAAGKPDDLPRDLTARREKRDALLVEKRDAEAASALLQADLERAQSQLAEVRQHVAAKIAAVIDHQTAIDAAEMQAHQRAAFALKRRLQALRDFRIGNAQYRLTPAVFAAVDRPAEPWAQIPQNERNLPREAWSAIASALTENADAPLTDG